MNKTVLYFWSQTCRPCRALSPVIDTLTDEFDDVVNITRINAGGTDTRTREYDVMVTPTLVMLQDGKVLKRISGAVPMMKLRKEIAEVFNL